MPNPIMPRASVIVVTGLPATGKSTLARALASHFRIPLVAKDLIKEPLLDVLGATDATQSRRLSDASFAALFRLTREWAAGGTSFVLEGNFRPGEHESSLHAALGSARLAQVLCRVPEVDRLARLAARQSDPSRHAGHRLGERAAGAGDSFLELPSIRIVHHGASRRTVLSELDNWMNLRAASL